MIAKKQHPPIVFIIPRGEVIRNFLYSDTLDTVAQNARVTLLSVVYDEDFRAMFGSRAEKIIPLYDANKSEKWIVRYLRASIQMAYWRSVWSEAHRNRWAEHDYFAKLNLANRVKRRLNTAFWTAFANTKGLAVLSRTERAMSYWLRP